MPRRAANSGRKDFAMKLKRLNPGEYITIDWKFMIHTFDGFWFAVDTKTGQSVVDCENTFRQIKESLEAHIKSI